MVSTEKKGNMSSSESGKAYSSDGDSCREVEIKHTARTHISPIQTLEEQAQAEEPLGEVGQRTNPCNPQ